MTLIFLYSTVALLLGIAHNSWITPRRIIAGQVYFNQSSNVVLKVKQLPKQRKTAHPDTTSPVLSPAPKQLPRQKEASQTDNATALLFPAPSNPQAKKAAHNSPIDDGEGKWLFCLRPDTASTRNSLNPTVLVTLDINISDNFRAAVSAWRSSGLLALVDRRILFAQKIADRNFTSLCELALRSGFELVAHRSNVGISGHNPILRAHMSEDSASSRAASCPARLHARRTLGRTACAVRGNACAFPGE